MRYPEHCWTGRKHRHRFLAACGLLCGVVLSLGACNKSDRSNATSLNGLGSDAGIWANRIPELRVLNISNAELTELNRARDAGLSDAACTSLIKIARNRQKPFADGHPISDLLATGLSESAILELARLNQLGIWAGQSQALRLARLSDTVIVAVAERRSQGLPVISGEKLGELRNAGLTDVVILNLVKTGASEQRASEYIAMQQNTAGGHGFVYQGHRRH